MLSAQWHISARIFVEAKNEIWDFILRHPEGCTLNQIMAGTGYSYPMVSACTDELYVEGCISIEPDGRFKPENDH